MRLETRESKEGARTLIRKLHFIAFCCIISFFSFSSLVSLPVASAEGATLYDLGARVGDWATYRIDEAQPYSFSTFPQVGTIVNLTVESLGNFSLYDENNRTVMSWVTPSVAFLINGSSQYTYTFFDVPISNPSGIEEALLISCIPFYPKGENFWRALEPYASEFEMNVTQRTVTLTLESIEHYSSSSDNTTTEIYARYYYGLNINVETGVLIAYRRSESYLYKYTSYSVNLPPYNYNYSYSTSIGMTLNNTSVSSSSYSAADPVVAVSLFAPVLAVLVVAALSSRRRRYSHATTKTELLDRLSDEDLMKLARKAPGSQIDRQMIRTELIKIIKQSLSIEEIETTLESG
jgi:hypothetical protein